MFIVQLPKVQEQESISGKKSEEEKTKTGSILTKKKVVSKTDKVFQIKSKKDIKKGVND